MSFVTRLALVSTVAGVFAVQSQADILFNYADFSSTAGLTLAGSTTTASNQLEITPAAVGQSGAAYSTTAVTLGASDTFSTTFQFQFTKTGGIDPADGITFVLAASPTGLGTGGGGLGYLGVGNSVAIEFDSFENGGADSSSNHVAIDTNGAINDLDLVNPYGVSTCVFPSSYLSPGCMANGDVWSATIGYDGTNLSVSVRDTSSEAAPSTIYTSLPLDIESFLGTTNAFVGFTGGTGSGFEQQDILNWELADTSTLPPAVPEPSALILFVTVLLAIGFAARRKTGQTTGTNR